MKTANDPRVMYEMLNTILSPYTPETLRREDTDLLDGTTMQRLFNAAGALVTSVVVDNEHRMIKRVLFPTLYLN